ncbi:MAG: flagellin lysine-N-methylase [Oscillospiraceae bacterium]|nr:flagellin lysine-N-methylase [Oscillospiraceae bacterium]
MDTNGLTVQFFRQPRYYDSFSCIGGKCPMSCCCEWRVDWTKEEMEKLKNAECSENLKSIMADAFEENGNIYKIKLNDQKKCPFLTEDMLCSVQKELGEEYLSRTCRYYPRKSIVSGNTVLNYCNLSCCRVMDVLCSDKDCMILENSRSRSKKIWKARLDTETDLINHPELKYRKQLFEFFYELIEDDSRSIETSVILGALAAQSLTNVIQKGAYDRIPEYIKDIKKQIENPEQTEKLEAFKPKPEIRVGFDIRLEHLIVKSSMYGYIIENGNLSLDKFLRGEEKFYQDYADRPFALRNIALNLMLECNMPFRDLKFNLFENYCYFVAAVSAIKYVAASIYARGGNDPDNNFKIASAYVSRSFSHNDSQVGIVIKLLKIFNCTSPAYISTIIK